MNKNVFKQGLFLVVMVIAIVMFYKVGIEDIKDPTNDKGYFQFEDGEQLELRYVGQYISDRLDGIDTKDTITNTMRENLDFVIGTNQKIKEISDNGDSYFVKIIIRRNPLSSSTYLCLDFNKGGDNDILKNLSSGDKISFKSQTIDEVDCVSRGLNSITMKDAKIIINEKEVD